jgi:hypothetical protein
MDKMRLNRSWIVISLFLITLFLLIGEFQVFALNTRDMTMVSATSGEKFNPREGHTLTLESKEYEYKKDNEWEVDGQTISTENLKRQIKENGAATITYTSEGQQKTETITIQPNGYIPEDEGAEKLSDKERLEAYQKLNKLERENQATFGVDEDGHRTLESFAIRNSELEGGSEDDDQISLKVKVKEEKVEKNRFILPDKDVSQYEVEVLDEKGKTAFTVTSTYNSIDGEVSEGRFKKGIDPDEFGDQIAVKKDDGSFDIYTKDGYIEYQKVQKSKTASDQEKNEALEDAKIGTLTEEQAEAIEGLPKKVKNLLNDAQRAQNDPVLASHNRQVSQYFRNKFTQKYTQILDAMLENYLGELYMGVPAAICGDGIYKEKTAPKRISGINIPQTGFYSQMEQDILDNLRVAVVRAQREELTEDMYRYLLDLRLVADRTVEWSFYMKNSGKNIRFDIDSGSLASYRSFQMVYADGDGISSVFICQEGGPECYYDKACLKFSDEESARCVSIVEP